MNKITEKFDTWPEAVKSDLEKNEFNPNVGSDLVSETDRVRVWHLVLNPGERTPFHRHVLNYFWTCHSEGQARSYFEDGRVVEMSYAPGDTKHMDYAKGQYLLHSLENIGTTPLTFTTVEFKDSPNPPLPV